MSQDQREQMQDFFRRALLAVIAPCGLFLCHGVPDDSLRDVADLDRIDYEGESDPYLRGVLRS